MTQPQPRRNMLDRYELIAEIARGGMGTVYLARLEGVAGFQRLFAIKLMHTHLADDAQFVSMLLDEARIAARIHHANAVEIIDVCESPRGYYLVMPYVEGFTLERIIEHPTITPEQRIRLGLRVFRDATVGLHAAHEIRDDEGDSIELVHRDVSPQNILVGVDGVGRIADFGVARAAARITSSRPGTIKGKPCYMAPEQAKGAELDRRADVFALGTVLFEVLTGRQLFYSEAGDAAMLVRVLTDEVPTPSSVSADVPKVFDAICMKALDRDVDTRYQTARELAEALEEAAFDARLMASHHQVADGLRALFGGEIEERRVAIKAHLSGLVRPSLPIVGSDVFDVPRLGHPGTGASAAAAAPESDGVETRASGPHRPRGDASTRGWHEEVSAPEADAAPSDEATAHVAERAESAPPAHTDPSAPAEPPVTRPLTSPAKLAAILGLVGIVLIVIAWAIASGGDEGVATDAGDDTGAGDDTETARVTGTATETETATETATGTATETETAAAATETAAGAVPATDTASEGEARAAGDSRARTTAITDTAETVGGTVERTVDGLLGGRERAPTRPRSTPSTSSTRSTTMRVEPELENNPYLNR